MSPIQQQQTNEIIVKESHQQNTNIEEASTSTTTSKAEIDVDDIEFFKFSTYLNRNLNEKQLRELFYNDYMLGKEIGNGGFGTIFSGIRRKDNKPVAIKVIKKAKVTQWYQFKCIADSSLSSSASPHDINNNDLTGPITTTSPTTPTMITASASDIIYTRRIPLEIALMIRVRHVDNCIQIIDYLEQKNCFIIVMERYETYKDLFDYITERAQHGLPERQAKDYFQQIVRVILEIYSLGVLHRDIKDENILVDLSTNKLKLIDFGAGAFFHPLSSTSTTSTKCPSFSDFHGTRVYSPPEWILKQSYRGDRATVWSLGVLLFNMIYGDIPWEDDQDIINCSFYIKKNFSFKTAAATTTTAAGETTSDQPTTSATATTTNNSNNGNHTSNNLLAMFSSSDRDVDDLIRSCLMVNDLERIQLHEILNHKWFK